MTDPPGPAEEHTIPVSRTRPARRTQPVLPDQTDGSTVIARRETRRRAAREQPAPAGAPVAASDRTAASAPIPTAGRVASAPDAAADAVYTARPPRPVIVERTAPPARVPRTLGDPAATGDAERRRARRTALIVLVSAAALFVAAAASLLVVALGL